MRQGFQEHVNSLQAVKRYKFKYLQFFSKIQATTENKRLIAILLKYDSFIIPYIKCNQRQNRRIKLTENLQIFNQKKIKTEPSSKKKPVKKKKNKIKSQKSKQE